ncbi:methionyl-tRNA formyltransferase, mitochondrial [Eucyclogobius newberryi]|uniref:methionyl-tRNA formyltransferase, mitochondrial n=1 Tax=Eucyclogobius newberryi TaxID=166745 RepID=UPI003B59347B
MWMTWARAVKLLRSQLQLQPRQCRPLCPGRGHTPAATPAATPASSPAATRPWKVLFFGTDDFAVESLKVLSTSRKCGDSVVQALEVVTLSGDVPVKRFALQSCLPMHRWPPDIGQGQFDVGVVVSFGCLLPQKLINKFPFGILNVHPSLLPRWRGPAPIFHTILRGDEVTGVTVMQIRPHRFDVGPVLSQETYRIQQKLTSDELGQVLAVKGAQMLIDTLRNLREKLQNKKEQSTAGATFAPKIDKSLSWLVWEEQSADDIDRLSRAIGARIPLRTLWMGRTVKLLDFTGQCHSVVPDGSGKLVPGSVFYIKESDIVSVRCKDGWVGFRSVLLKKRLTAADFYNGYLHQSVKSPAAAAHGLFVSGRTPQTLCDDDVHTMKLPTT